jgi:DNA-binding NarL/FixJ family response regulator
LKVFIADDSAPVRQRLAAQLSELESVELVGQAGDAHAALEAIWQLRPDVVVLDIRMPGGSGLQVLEALKRDTPAPTVIMLTAFPYPQYRRKCLEAGAEYFFDKTTEFERVARVLREMSESAAVSGDNSSASGSGLPWEGRSA